MTKLLHMKDLGKAAGVLAAFILIFLAVALGSYALLPVSPALALGVALGGVSALVVGLLWAVDRAGRNK